MRLAAFLVETGMTVQLDRLLTDPDPDYRIVIAALFGRVQ